MKEDKYYQVDIIDDFISYAKKKEFDKKQISA